MEESYRSFINSFLSESFKKLDSHYCDVLIIDITNLSIFKPSLYLFDNKSIYEYMNISTGKNTLYDTYNIVDILDTHTLKKIIDFVIANKHFTHETIYKHIESVSDDFNEIYSINTYVEPFSVPDSLYGYYQAISTAIWNEFNFQCRGYIVFETDLAMDDLYVTEDTSNIYIYDKASVQFQDSKSYISLALRFFRKKE